ncbi:hypothetical protein [Rhodobium gokarnense]|uniref:DUF91 domain-containing protein n=1 Tax=Rhodobium gokarnense TaxID=364296 RepID=A0ABT3HBX6_9HYPH|nr:hypothetical protein [Rhodobium gokarnense]MCW2307902.1 hypothetical protein [Rhodobium gokarnense]
MRKRIFFNVGWMEKYQGLKNCDDELKGGGRYPEEFGEGGEVNNFGSARDKNVYGHVETSIPGRDRRINIEELLGAEKDSQKIDGVDVFWTATHPTERRRRVVGWYRNATVYRERQILKEVIQSKQHVLDGRDSFITVASAENAFVLPPALRTLRLGTRKGWMGHTPWWAPDRKKNLSNNVKIFLSKLDGLVEFWENTGLIPPVESPSPARDPVWRYITEQEILISPKHSELQKKFTNWTAEKGNLSIEEDVDFVDVRYIDKNKNLFLCEIKPCEIGQVRFAIRTAMGQLLDYCQREMAKVKRIKSATKPKLLIVLERKPNEEDEKLALSNGFGLAYPKQQGFKISFAKN